MKRQPLLFFAFYFYDLNTLNALLISGRIQLLVIKILEKDIDEFGFYHIIWGGDNTCMGFKRQQGDSKCLIIYLVASVQLALIITTNQFLAHELSKAHANTYFKRTVVRVETSVCIYFS